VWPNPVAVASSYCLTMPFHFAHEFTARTLYRWVQDCRNECRPEFPYPRAAFLSAYSLRSEL
jgi:hypothetical protein